MSAGRRLRDVDDPLMAALKEWRLTTARSDGVPGLRGRDGRAARGDRRPAPDHDPGARRVKGMGPSRLARYGAELLEIVTASR